MPAIKATPGRAEVQGLYQGVTAAIKRPAIEPVIGHCKEAHRTAWQRDGDAINTVLAAAGYNFRLLIAWLRLVIRLLLQAFMHEPALPKA